jgi:hypothetical protein
MTVRFGPINRRLFSSHFGLYRVKKLAPKHPKWETGEPFAPLLKGDVKGALAGGEPAVTKNHR